MQKHTKSQLKSPPIYLTVEQAREIEVQFKGTAQYRGWKLVTYAIMRNHVHLVVGVNGDPESETILRDFKSYASRRLNQTWQKPESGTWWTESGSRRKLTDEFAVSAAVEYVKNQEYPLVVGIDDEWNVRNLPGG